MVYGIFNDLIVHDEILINELPPFTMSRLRIQKSHMNYSFWKTMKESQCTPISNSLILMDSILSKEYIISASKESPIDWNPSTHFQRFESQSEESYNEQQNALKYNVDNINKFITVNGRQGMTYTKM